MGARPSPSAQPLAPPPRPDAAGPLADAEPAPWSVARDGLAGADTYWLATVRPDGRPHAVPVLGVLVDDAVHFAAGGRTRKARNLVADPRCTVTAHGPSLDLVVEGEAVRVDDPDAVRRVAEAYREKYGWHPQVREGALWAEGAPTAGPAPYQVYRVEPAVVFGFPTDEGTVPTRWRF